jgi:uncharacterized membrane protein YciS (DUF1049 family)
MRKFLFYFGFILTTVVLELFYINLQINDKIDKIENSQKQYNYAIETMDQMSDQTLSGIDESRTLKLSSIE